MLFIKYWLILSFLLLNIVIIYNDLKRKKIPNVYLGYLLIGVILHYLYFLITWWEINIIWKILDASVFLSICFWLFYASIWAAGDAKYTFVLFLYLLWSYNILTFFFNLSCLVWIYLCGYFIYFYSIKLPFRDKNWAIKSYIKTTIEDSYKIKFLRSSDLKWKIIKTIFQFLVFFTAFRLLRMVAIEEIKYSLWSSIHPLFLYFLIAGFGILIVAIRQWVLSLIMFFKKYNFRSIHIVLYIQQYFLPIVFFLLSIYVGIELYFNPLKISRELLLIMTLYLCMYGLVRFLRFSQIICFHISEEEFIDITRLDEGYIVDKKFLKKSIAPQPTSEKYLLPDPYSFIKNIPQPIDKKTAQALKKTYKKLNEYHLKNKTEFFQEMKYIKVVKSFSFSLYIFLWFLVTYIFENKFLLIFTEVLHLFLRRIFNV